jgi:hypothetical protein
MNRVVDLCRSADLYRPYGAAEDSRGPPTQGFALGERLTVPPGLCIVGTGFEVHSIHNSHRESGCSEGRYARAAGREQEDVLINQ